MSSENVIDYDQYAKKTSLKGEFVRLIRDDQTLSEEEKKEIIDCGLRALDGEELLI